MRGRRTSFKLGPTDVDDLLAAIAGRIRSVDSVMQAFDRDRSQTDELLRLYRLRNRLVGARARLDGQRDGRSAAAS